MDDYRYPVSILDFIGTSTLRYSQNSIRIVGRRGNHEDEVRPFKLRNGCWWQVKRSFCWLPIYTAQFLVGSRRNIKDREEIENASMHCQRSSCPDGGTSRVQKNQAICEFLSFCLVLTVALRLPDSQYVLRS